MVLAMNRNTQLIMASILFATFIFAIPIETGPQTVRGSNQATVAIVDYAFSPKHLNVTTGTTVIWNYGSGYSEHTVTSVGNTTGSGSPLFNSGTLSPGQSYQHTFNNPGVYTYQCSFHYATYPAMANAWVNVTGTPVSPPPQTSTPPDYTLVTIIGGLFAAVAGTAAVVIVARRRKGKAQSVK